MRLGQARAGALRPYVLQDPRTFKNQCTKLIGGGSKNRSLGIYLTKKIILFISICCFRLGKNGFGTCIP